MRGRVRAVSAYERIALDQDWELASIAPGVAAKPEDVPVGAWREARPGTVAAALGPDALPTSTSIDALDWWWRIPLGGATGTLCLPGIATLWDAWIDGTHVASGDNMFIANEIALMAPSHELVIRCRSIDAELAKKRPRPRWRVPMLEQQQLRWIRTTLLGRTPGWSPPWPAIGPWRAPYIVKRAHVEVGRVHLESRLEGVAGVVEIRADIGALGDGVGSATGVISSVVLVVERDDQRFTASLAISAGATSITATPGAGATPTWVGRVTVEKAARWYPHTHGEPALYRASLEVALADVGDIQVVELGTVGFRTVTVSREEGDFAIRVNGAPIFCRGACWTPLDPASLSASAEAYDAAVKQVADAGMNMVRVGGTMVYEDDAFYDALDRHGVLLWQDLMFANMDYPGDEAFTTSVVTEVDQQLARLQARPCVTVISGNSEGQQQAAMSGASRERWSPALFHDTIPARVREHLPRVPYVPSSTDGGAFPHQPNRGVSSYYGVGAYLRPLDDARRSEVRFASECLAFANIPSDPTLPRVHDARWKARSPRDLGAGWDFDDVRDHYVQRLFALDPLALRVADHDRYLALGRFTTGEVMAQTFAEWRRARSTCRGALIWFLRDLWYGAGWGVIDAHGSPKLAYYALRRALAPIAVSITDEGNNGLALHVVNDRAAPLAARLDLTLYRTSTHVGHGSAEVTVAAHSAIERNANELLDGFYDLSFAYRFGPPVADAIHATLSVNDTVIHEAFHFPAGYPRREVDVGLTARITTSAGGPVLEVTSQRLAHAITIEGPSLSPADNGFSLAPGQTRTIALAVTGALPGGKLRGTVTALNAEAAARFEGAP